MRLKTWILVMIAIVTLFLAGRHELRKIESGARPTYPPGMDEESFPLNEDATKPLIKPLATSPETHQLQGEPIFTEFKQAFEFRVLREIDGRPIPGAMIRLQYNHGPQQRGFTDQDGVANLEIIPKTFSVDVTAEGYAKASRHILEPFLADRMDFKLNKGARIWGYVKDTEGKVVRGARVFTSGQTFVFTDTDSEGYFELDHIPLTGFKLVGMAPYHERHSITVNALEPGGQQFDISLKYKDFQSDEWITLKGQVLDEQDNPVDNPIINVSCGNHCNNRENMGVQLNYFEINMKSDHRHEVKFDKPGFRSEQILISGDSLKEEVHQIILKRGHWLKGMVVDEENQPIKSASVREPDEDDYSRTDEMGNFHLDGLGEGPVNLKVFADGFPPKTVRNVPVNQDGLVIRMTISEGYAGRIINKQGEPITRFTLHGFYEREDGDRFPLFFPKEIVHESGYFFLANRENYVKFHLTVKAEGYGATKASLLPQKREDAQNNPTTIVLDELQFVEGYLLDMQDQPRAGVPVQLGYGGDFSVRKASLSSFSRRAFSFMFEETQSDERGYFRIEAPPSGEEAALIYGGGHVAINHQFLAGKTRGQGVLKIKLPDAARIEGEVNPERVPVNTKIYVTHIQNPFLDAETSVDRAGRFSFDGLLPGKYQIAIERVYLKDRLIVELEAGATLRLPLSIDGPQER